MTTAHDKSIRLAQLKHAQRVAAALRKPKKNPRRVKTSGEDRGAADELILFAENDADLYRQQLQPIQLNLLRKYAAGKYDGLKAPKLWEYLLENAAQKYAKEFGGGLWFNIFTPETRRYAAKQMAGSFEQSMRAGEHDSLIMEKGGVHAKRLAALRASQPARNPSARVKSVRGGAKVIGKSGKVVAGYTKRRDGPGYKKVAKSLARSLNRKKNPAKKGADIVKGGFVLVHEATKKPVKYGERLTDFRGEKTTLHDATPPAAEGKSGYVYVGAAKADEFARARYYVDVYDLKWIPAKAFMRAANPGKVAAKNPDGPYVIALYGDGGKRMTYDANKNRFTDNSLPALYRTQIAAVERGEWLVKSNTKLRRYKIVIEAADQKERGAVFGARPRQRS